MFFLQLFFIFLWERWRWQDVIMSTNIDPSRQNDLMINDICEFDSGIILAGKQVVI